MVAATGDDKAVADFFLSRMVFSEAAHVKCLRHQVPRSLSDQAVAAEMYGRGFAPASSLPGQSIRL